MTIFELTKYLQEIIVKSGDLPVRVSCGGMTYPVYLENVTIKEIADEDLLVQNISGIDIQTQDDHVGRILAAS